MRIFCAKNASITAPAARSVTLWRTHHFITQYASHVTKSRRSPGATIVTIGAFEIAFDINKTITITLNDSSALLKAGADGIRRKNRIAVTRA